MRHKGTIYPEIERLPARAMLVSEFAASHKPKSITVGSVYMKYKRYYMNDDPKRKYSNPGYTIRCFKKSNFVIPD